MVDTGNGEHGNKGSTVNGAAEDSKKVISQSRFDHTAQQNRNTQSTAYDVGTYSSALRRGCSWEGFVRVKEFVS